MTPDSLGNAFKIISRIWTESAKHCTGSSTHRIPRHRPSFEWDMSVIELMQLLPVFYSQDLFDTNYNRANVLYLELAPPFSFNFKIIFKVFWSDLQGQKYMPIIYNCSRSIKRDWLVSLAATLALPRRRTFENRNQWKTWTCPVFVRTWISRRWQWQWVNKVKSSPRQSSSSFRTWQHVSILSSFHN